MGLLITRVRSSAGSVTAEYDGAAWANAPAPVASALWTNTGPGATASAALFSIPLRIDPSATVNSASITLFPSVSVDLTGKSLTIALLPEFTEDVSAVDPAGTPIASTSVALGQWTAGKAVVLDLGTMIASLIVEAGYDTARNGVFLLTCDAIESDGAAIAAFDLDAWQAPILSVDFDWQDGELDPYTQVINGLWDLLEACPSFAALVKIGNRIKFTHATNRSPMKETLSESDVPEVRIVCASSSPHIHRTSSSSSDVVQFQIQVASGDQRVQIAHYPVKWAVYRALRDWLPYLQNLRWKGLPFIKRVAPIRVEEGAEKKELNRGIIGWSAIWACEAELWFRTLDL